MAIVSSVKKERKIMGGIVILGTGIGLIALSVVLLVVSVVYQRTAGKRIREALKKEYG